MEDIAFESFGSLLRYYRKRWHLTQRQLAAKIGVHHNTISTWERDNFLPETRTTVLEIARQLSLNQQESRFLLEASLRELSPYWYMPYQRNPFFMGRQALLHTMHQKLSREKTAHLSQTYALCGPGGVGKTQVAIEYVYRYFQEYTAIFWFSAQTREHLLSSFFGVADQLHFSAQGGEKNTQEKMIAFVLRWLNIHHGWLLIFDGVKDLELLQAFLPAARSGALLFTTCLSDFALLAPCLELHPLSQDVECPI